MNKIRRTNQTAEERKRRIMDMLADPAIGASTPHRIAQLENISATYARRLLTELADAGLVFVREEPHRPGWKRRVYYVPIARRPSHGGRRTITINGRTYTW